jgi:hypothetical protein
MFCLPNSSELNSYLGASSLAVWKLISNSSWCRETPVSFIAVSTLVRRYLVFGAKRIQSISTRTFSLKSTSYIVPPKRETSKSCLSSRIFIGPCCIHHPSHAACSDRPNYVTSSKNYWAVYGTVVFFVLLVLYVLPNSLFSNSGSLFPSLWPYERLSLNTCIKTTGKCGSVYFHLYVISCWEDSLSHLWRVYLFYVTTNLSFILVIKRCVHNGEF